MAMTESEVEKLEKQVMEGFVLNPRSEMDWINEQSAALVKDEQMFVAAFRLHKQMRDDGKMKKAGEALEHTRKTLLYFKERLLELAKLV